MTTAAFVCCLCSKRIGADRAHALLAHPPPRVAHITCVWQHHRLDDTEHTGTRAGIAALLAHELDAHRARAAEAID